MIILKFIWRRLATALLAITAVLIAAFLLVRLTPNPVALIAGPEAEAAWRAIHHLCGACPDR